MIKKYLRERRSWIIFFVFLQVLFLLIAYIDPGISFSAILYIVFLSSIFFIIFIVMRYNKETTFYKSLEEWDDTSGVGELDHGSRPFEQLMYKRITEQLKQYKDELNHYETDLEQEKDEVLSWIHEVKTPLTTMQLMIERIEEEPVKQQLMVEWLRIDLLLDQQLHQKRMPFMENDLYIEKVSIQPLIHQEIKAFQSWCMQKGIGFEITFHVTEVLTDKKWLGFIIRQLLTNAIKYSEHSDITIRSYANNNGTKLEIMDVGRGIATKDLARIFDKGFTSTSDHGDQSATGMGLYLVEKVAKSLLIQIDVKSEHHIGTTFTLIFPKKNEFVHIASM